MSETVRRFATTVTWIFKSGERGGGERKRVKGGKEREREEGKEGEREKEMRRIDVERGEGGREGETCVNNCC